MNRKQICFSRSPERPAGCENSGSDRLVQKVFKHMSNIISIENNAQYQETIRQSLAHEHELLSLSFVEEFREPLARQIFDVGIIAIDSHGSGGLQAFQALSTHLGDAPIIVTSRQEDPDWIVQVVRAGAFDFIAKPYSGEKLRLAVDLALEKARLRHEIDYLRRQQDVVYDLDRIIALSPAMQSVMELVRRYSASDSNILLTGETGTGKSFLAGAVHFNSERRTRPFVKINCANIPETLLESELFGHEKGAFTGAVKTRRGRIEQADGGTVLLDEIGEMTPALQSKLLQVVEEKSFERLGGSGTVHSNVRIIAATNQDLPEMVRQNLFRQDLYFRLNVLAIHLPPLRQRQECIEPLAGYLMERICREAKKKPVDFHPLALNLLKKYAWPGNIRELANVIERAVLLESGPVITRSSIHLDSSRAVKPEQEQPASDRKLEESEFQMIMQALERNLWIQKKAAAELGISPRALNYKIKKLGITHWSWRRNRG